MAKKKKKHNRRVKIAPLGYFVLGALSIIALEGVVFGLTTIFGSEPVAVAQIQETTPIPATMAPQSLGIVPETTPSAVQLSEPAAVTAEPQASMPDPTATPGMHNDVRMPTAEQIANAKEGELLHSGVAMRRGPDTGYGIVDKYAAGTKVDIFGAIGDYYFVKTLSDGQYGYIASKFISAFGMVSNEEPTPVPETMGLIDGIVGGNKVALRSVPTSQGNDPIGQCNKDAKVWVYYETNNFYFIEVVGSGEKGYISKDYVSVSERDTVPIGTPDPHWP